MKIFMLKFIWLIIHAKHSNHAIILVYDSKAPGNRVKSVKSYISIKISENMFHMILQQQKRSVKSFYKYFEK